MFIKMVKNNYESDSSCITTDTSENDSENDSEYFPEKKISSQDEDDEPFNKYDEDILYDKLKNNKNFNINFFINKIQHNDHNDHDEGDEDCNSFKKCCDNDVIKNKKKRKYDKITKKYSSLEKKFFNNLKDFEKKDIYENENIILNNSLNNKEIPLRFKFLNLNIPNNTKSIILSKIEQLNDMQSQSGDYHKLNNWIKLLDKIPLGKYHSLPISNNNNFEEISKYLQNVKNIIDKNVYGHVEAKEQIIRILAQWISYPNANGYIIGIKGSMGIGKTKLVKEGICNALNFPFSFISLGGVSDASYLRGHDYTYEGSTYGKIVECLMKAGVMNPVIFFDELDKVSSTYKGDEIINTLIHLTDPTQNKNFTDRYFEEIDLDISKSLIIFTYNNENLINPILKDRMITINVSGYNLNEKITIAKNYLIVEILSEYNIDINDIVFSDNIIKYIIQNTEEEEGVRNLKRNINNIVSWINVMKYMPHNDFKISFPFEINSDFVDKYIKRHNTDLKKEIQYSIYT